MNEKQYNAKRQKRAQLKRQELSDAKARAIEIDKWREKQLQLKLENQVNQTTTLIGEHLKSELLQKIKENGHSFPI